MIAANAVPARIDGREFLPTRDQLARARHLPGHIYTSLDIQAIEKDKIFMRDWLCVGRVEEVKQPGDYMALRIMDEPVLIVRDRDGTINAFANVCRHRGVEVAPQGEGHAKEFICPYHAWAYDLGGRLIGAPYMRDSDVDLANCRLPRLALETWRGWLFLNFNPSPPPLGTFIAPFEDEFGFLRPEDCVLVDKTVMDLNCNWKFVIENLMDIYHVGTIHARTFGNYYKGDRERYGFKMKSRGTYSFFFDAAPLTRDGKSLFGKMPWLADRPDSFACLGFLAPNVNFAARCDTLRHWVTWPLAPGRSRLISYTLVPHAVAAEPGVDAKIREVVTLLKEIIDEDRAMVESLQNGVRSRLFDPGPMSRLEGPIHHIINNYLDELSA